MRSLILAAGRGSRMGSLTDPGPKCLVRLGGRPLLEWQVAALTEAGCGTIAVVGGYQADRLRDSRWQLFVNGRWSETNMVASLLSAVPWIDEEPVVVSYSDIVYDPDAPRRLALAPGDLAITYDRLWRSLWEERFADPLRDAETFEVDTEGRLVEIGARARSLDEVKGQYMGLLRFTPKAVSAVRDVVAGLPDEQARRLDMTSLLRRLLAKGFPIGTVPVDGRWCEVDSETDLALYEAHLASSTPWVHDFRWAGSAQGTAATVTSGQDDPSEAAGR
ncbi:MAG: phosphocholine cytidylyltransferase family protein [Holophagales bacterium]|nr:phosphocholine cytidylyltransferase family protein [Holophagales bacterium]